MNSLSVKKKLLGELSKYLRGRDLEDVMARVSPKPVPAPEVPAAEMAPEIEAAPEAEPTPEDLSAALEAMGRSE